MRHYLSISKLQRPLEVTIDHSPPITPIPYSATLLHYEKLGLLSSVELSPVLKDLVQECLIFKCTEKIEYNQGILIYCGDYLLERFKYPFGQLIPSKFYKKKIKKSEGLKNLFDFVGVVHLRKEEELDSVHTSIRDKRKMKRIIEELTKILKKEKEEETEICMNALWDMRMSLNK